MHDGGEAAERLARELIPLGGIGAYLSRAAETEAATCTWLAQRRWKQSLNRSAFNHWQAA